MKALRLLRTTSARVVIATAIVCVVSAGSIQPSSAHGDGTRTLPYNTQVSKTDGFTCSYDIKHGNFGGAYLNAKLTAAACDRIFVDVDGCSGLDCRTAYANTSSRYLWISAQLLSGFNIIYSHNDAWWSSGQTFRWHNNV